MLRPMGDSVIHHLARLPAKHPLTGTPARQAKNILILISSMVTNTQDLTLPTTQRIVLGYSKPGEKVEVGYRDQGSSPEPCRRKL